MPSAHRGSTQGPGQEGPRPRGDGRNGVRQARREGNERLKKMEREHQLGQDDERRGLDEIQKLHDRYIEEIGTALEHKEKDILPSDGRSFGGEPRGREPRGMAPSPWPAFAFMALCPPRAAASGSAATGPKQFLRPPGVAAARLDGRPPAPGRASFRITVAAPAEALAEAERILPGASWLASSKAARPVRPRSRPPWQPRPPRATTSSSCTTRRAPPPRSSTCARWSSRPPARAARSSGGRSRTPSSGSRPGGSSRRSTGGTLFRAETPQVFRRSTLERALERARVRAVRRHRRGVRCRTSRRRRDRRRRGFGAESEGDGPGGPGAGRMAAVAGAGVKGERR